MKYSANGIFVYKKSITGLTKEHFNNSIIEKWSADNLIYTTDGKVGIGTRDPRKKLHINGDIKSNNICLTNENGDEECINLAFILLAKELILGVIPEEYRDLELLNSLSKDDIKQNLLPKHMTSQKN